METYTDFGVSYLIQTFINKYKILKLLSSYPPSHPEFQVFRKNILHFMKQAKMCCSNRSSGVYALNQGHMT